MQDIQTKDFADHIDISIWKKLLKYLKKYKKSFFAMTLFMMLLAANDVVLPLLTKYSIDHFILPKSTQGLPVFILVSACIVLASVIFVYLFIYFAGKVESGVSHSVREDGFAKLQTLPFSYYDRMPSGYLISRMTSDANHLGTAFSWITIDMIWGSTYLFISLIAMFSISVTLSLIVVFLLIPLFFISSYFVRRILRAQRKVRKKNSEITDAFSEGIMGAKTSKTLVLEDKNIDAFDALGQNMRQSSLKAAKISAMYMPIVISISALATASILSIGSGLVQVGGMSIGSITAFFSYTLSLFDPIHNLASSLAEMQRMQASAERVIGLLETDSDIKDSEEVEEIFGDSFHPKKENWPEIKGDIEFENVSFQYKDGEKVLENFNLKVKAGQTIALVGKTGSGKSTIVNLVCRFYEPTAGRILIDGVDYRKRSQLWLQSKLGYVLQQPHLFSGSIRDNIAYAKKDATDEEIENAVRSVHAEHFIARLENGVNSSVGEGGNKLSTGEKQLISFARALIINPRIFVLDEATSSIDTETELFIQSAIEKTLKGRTAFIIAHRLSTIRNADRILLIDKGKIIEDGTHDALMALRKEYYTLYTNQFTMEESEKLLSAAL